MKMEKLGCGVDEARRAFARTEQGMCNDVFKKLQIGRQATDAKFAQGAIHACRRFVRAMAPGGHLDQQRVIVGGDDGACVGGSGVKTNAKAAAGTIRN